MLAELQCYGNLNLEHSHCTNNYSSRQKNCPRMQVMAYEDNWMIFRNTLFFFSNIYFPMKSAFPVKAMIIAITRQLEKVYMYTLCIHWDFCENECYNSDVHRYFCFTFLKWIQSTHKHTHVQSHIKTHSSELVTGDNMYQ